MKILGVRLRNIRSYIDKTIVFPPSGTTVIYGDNGTGKTSILLGINYALFGLPRGQKSSDLYAGFVSPYRNDLLRAGTSSAMVRLLIKHRGKLILVERRLNGDRGGRIEVYGSAVFSGSGGALKPEFSSSYSSEDLTEKILEILGLREDPKKSRSTYIFSNVMYVPQFNIQQTLSLDDKQRRELVDRVLGLDKYMTALNNIEKIAKGKNSVIGSELFNINKMIEDRRKILEKINVNDVRTRLSELENRRDELSRELSELHARQESLKTEKEKRESARNELNRRRGELMSRIEMLDRKKRELMSKKEKLSRILSESGLSSASSVDELVRKLQEREQGLENEYSYVSRELERLDEELRSVENEEREVLTNVSKMEGGLESIKSRVRDAWNEVLETKNLVAQGICPKCKQPITREYGEELVREKYVELREIAMRVVPLIKDLWSWKLRHRKLSSVREEIRRRRADLSKRKDEVLRELNEIKIKLSQVTELHEEISKLEQEVSEKTKVEEELDVVERELKKLNDEISELNIKLSEVEGRRVSLSKELGGVTEQIKNLREKLEEYNKLNSELRDLELRASILSKVEDYLIRNIYKAVETIESTVRSLAHDRFSEYFQEYFIKLLEDQELVEASVSDFKPIPKVRTSAAEVYEISQPSGAQISALGLAYRLALNRVVRDLNKELRGSVLIMDEPTHGFSPERVEKLRELIESVRSDLGDVQVILVTHDERLLEIGDCRIRLSIDQSRYETLVNYEECFMRDENIDFQDYKNFISGFLMRRFGS